MHIFYGQNLAIKQAYETIPLLFHFRRLCRLFSLSLTLFSQGSINLTHIFESWNEQMTLALKEGWKIKVAYENVQCHTYYARRVRTEERERTRVG